MKEIAETVYYILAAIAAIGAFWVYRRNSRLERARWSSNLYEKFYEGSSYKKIRELLDNDCTGKLDCPACELTYERHADNFQLAMIYLTHHAFHASISA